MSESRRSARGFFVRGFRGRVCRLDLWHELIVAVALVFIIEGVMPFISPGRWRRMVETLAHYSDGSMRTVGLISMVFGVGLLYLVN